MADIQRWAKEFLEFCDGKFPGIQKTIEEKQELHQRGRSAELNKAITEFNATFQITPGAKI